jgi:hypothetical protein
MKIGVTSLERAFELARSGSVSTVEEIRFALKHEGYSVSEIRGPSLQKQLSALVRAARAESKTDGH